MIPAAQPTAVERMESQRPQDSGATEEDNSIPAGENQDGASRTLASVSLSKFNLGHRKDLNSGSKQSEVDGLSDI